MKFEDITKSAGVGTTRWATGATMVDINGDGFLDIYVSVSGPEWSKPEDRANLLFINNGNRTFTEAAAQYGIADQGFTTQAAFLDYNGDGCLDLFLLENSPNDFSRADVASTPLGMSGQTPGSQNQLYKNDCHGKFTNVSTEAGILRAAGYGLGVAVADLNGDGWPDIYVSNDVITNDVLYINNGNGTFTNKRDAWLKHASFAGMGVDIADFNNDGWPDIMQADMMPRALARRKRTSGFMTYNNQLFEVAEPRLSRRLLGQHAPVEQRRDAEWRSGVQRDRADGGNLSHGLELERPLRRLRQRRLQGRLHRQRLSESGQRPRLHSQLSGRRTTRRSPLRCAKRRWRC